MTHIWQGFFSSQRPGRTSDSLNPIERWKRFVLSSSSRTPVFTVFARMNECPRLFAGPSAS